MQKIDILFIAANARSLVANRGELIKSLTHLGLVVGALVPEYDYLDNVTSLDIPIWRYKLNRHSINPLQELVAFWQLRQQITSIAPQSVFAYAMKPITFGVAAARLAGVKHIYCLVTGLGYLFTANSIEARIFKQISRILLASSAILSELFIFQNPDDQKELEKGWMFRNFAKSIVVNGSGVDLKAYPFLEPDTTKLIFICVARLLQEKGIREFVQAATAVKQIHPSVCFWLLGGLDKTLKNSITQTEIEQWQAQGSVEFLGQVSDVRPYLQKSSVMVLPSYYREGIPRSILEAMSVGRPIITCDTPGCRETVQNGVNGYLVPPRDVASLEERMLWFIENPFAIKTMGAASRRLAEEKFDVVKVNKAILAGMNLSQPLHQSNS